jgi:AAA+ superfamily predicted ATPase
MSALLTELRTAVQARHPLIYLHTPEEDRVCEAVAGLSAELFPQAPVRTWSCARRLEPGGGADTRDPIRALESLLATPTEGFCILKDLSAFLHLPGVVRTLRDAYFRLLSSGKLFLVIVSPVVAIPPELENDAYLLDVPLPGSDELIARARAAVAEHPGASLPADRESEIALALRGLTLNEVSHVMHRVFGGSETTPENLMRQIFQEKKRLVRKAGFLEYISQRVDMDRIGGLENVKEWAMNRKGLFTQEALARGLPTPKGVLVMGVSGCGKSMTAKALASLWNLPLFRLDMNLIFSGIYGSPEAAFHKALRAIESVAPAVLWIDEIENALGMTVETSTSEQSLTFSAFLTWMQERPPLVFVAATANRIESLPAEVLRKGRFDQVFFCDLPDAYERREIFRIHLETQGAKPGDVDIERLLNSTKGWSGAEIEQAIASARVDANKEGRSFTTEDIRRHTISMVPLSETMVEQIRAIRSWAFNRATRASKKRDSQ